jgi:hypothetical protein
MAESFALVLKQHPHKVFLSESPQEGERWLQDLDLIRQFPAVAEIRSFMIGYAAHPTHWLVMGITRNSPDSAQNGYYLYCYPKSKYASADLKEIFVKGMGPAEVFDPEKN